ncbi:MAG: hypothetical protein JWO74_4384, partial [Solirubrobacterales bacterium]|nr:hypothetical protein [Solirubrobacterales bacterium]
MAQARDAALGSLTAARPAGGAARGWRAA